jgi:Rad3-related DNA helicase
LDVSLFVDGIICDYNYVFDPRVKLRRYFAEGAKGDFLFLVDEAHNLVERARSMYSAVLVKEDFLAVKKLVKPYSKKVAAELEKSKRPTFGENLTFFFKYQLNFMYWRYFLWNFSGRQNDMQSYGEIDRGNWITGISFIDNLLVGDLGNTKIPA